MDSILEELFHGNIAPNTQYFNKQSKFGKAMKILTDAEDEVLSTLIDAEKKILKRYINAQLEVNSLTAKTKASNSVLKSCLKLWEGYNSMYRVDAEASEQVEVVTRQLLRRNPMPHTENILEPTRHFNAQRCIAEELVIHEMAHVAR